MSSTHYSAIPAPVDHVRPDQANTTHRHNPENQPPNPFPNPANLDNLVVVAGEKPAARLTDMHTCPESTGPVPHVGGPIMPGSPNVFIGGLPAARVTDPVTCVGPPDTIVMGAPTVRSADPAGLSGRSSTRHRSRHRDRRRVGSHKAGPIRAGPPVDTKRNTDFPKRRPNWCFWPTRQPVGKPEVSAIKKSACDDQWS
ncbi:MULTISPECIES: PAAR domain-containing protein [unclassified Acidiphilium]|uniref:PAAR domain-containing protein n=2 Tax=Acidocellaceae TaxID=3385905 RepID=UPI00267C0816